MSTHTFSRRTVLKGAAALSCSSLILPALTPPAAAQGQGGPNALRAAEGSLPELAGQGQLALFNQALPGPVLRVKKGAALSVSLENAMKENLSLVWQGVRTAAGTDPSAPVVAAGAKADIGFTPRDAGTFWYHAADPALARRALAGALVVEEEGAPAYESDHVLFIQSFPPETGLPLFPVNGAISPTFQGPASGRTRLRLINATPLFLRIRVNAPESYVIAVDGQPAEPFAPKDSRVQIAPGGRVDLAVTLGGADPAILSIESSQDPVQLAIVTPVGAGGTAPSGPPAPLPGNGLPAELPFSDAARFTFKLEGGAAEAPPPSLGSVKAGRVVVLTLDNPLDAPVTVRIDGHPVRLLDANYDGWSPWWHDTVPVRAKGTARVAFKAENAGTWSIVAQRSGDSARVAARTYQVTA
ncbi:multicopper oxidase family protein [Xanthobacter sediminis]|uniref:multicopper oxidase family protein n=1 Tax=Xanthobacter sediminis TaxID=3119926 RepID=UPI00372B8015